MSATSRRSFVRNLLSASLRLAAASLPSREELMAAQKVSTGSDWRVKMTSGELTLRPYAEIATEPYRLYHEVV